MGSVELDPNTLDALLCDQSYVGGHQPTQADTQVWQALGGPPDPQLHPHTARWYTHMASFKGESHAFPPAPIVVVFHGPKSPAQAPRVAPGKGESGEPQSAKPQKAPSKKKDAEVSQGCGDVLVAWSPTCAPPGVLWEVCWCGRERKWGGMEKEQMFSNMDGERDGETTRNVENSCWRRWSVERQG